MIHFPEQFLSSEFEIHFVVNSQIIFKSKLGLNTAINYPKL